MTLNSIVVAQSKPVKKIKLKKVPSALKPFSLEETEDIVSKTVKSGAPPLRLVPIPENKRPKQ